MASSGWQAWNGLYTSSFGYDYFKCSIRIDSISHSGNTVTISGAFGVLNDGGYESYYVYPINARIRDVTNYQQVVAGSQRIAKNDIVASGVSFSFSVPASNSSASFTIDWLYNNSTASNAYTYTVYFDPSYSAPTGLSVSIAEKYPDGAKFNVSVSSYGNPSSASGRYIEAAILNQNTYGATYKFSTASNTSSSAITVNGSSTGGTLAIQPNKQYYYGAYASNTQLSTNKVQGQFVTLAPSPTVTVGSVDAHSAVIEYSTVADGGYYDKIIEYSTDGGITWTTGATITGGSAQTGSFTIDNLPADTSNSVEIRTRTTSGSDTPITITIQTSPGGVALYGSVNGVSKKVQKLYGSVNGQAKTILKVYGSVGGVSKLVYELPAYGIVTFYTDSGHTTTDTAVLKSQADVNLLTGGSYSATWSATIDGKTVTSDNIKGISLTSMVSRLPEYFLCNSVVLDSLDISQTKLVSTPTGFMRGCVIFNQNVVFPSTLRTIGNMNFYGCSVFNSNINIGNVTEIGTSFLGDCFEFNKPLDTSNATFINSGFLRCGSASNVMKFNQPLNLGKLQTLGASFLGRCRCFNQDITLPASLTYIGSSFLEGMRDMSHTVYCNTSTVPAKSSNNKQYSLSTYGNDYASAASYQSGIKLGGTYKNEWKAECPDCSGTDNLYRKTVLV